MEITEYLEELAQSISILPLKYQKLLIHRLSQHLGDKREEILTELADEMISSTKKYAGLKKWVDARFSKNMGLTPRRVAAESVRYFHINAKMMPFLIKTCQRVKNRVAKRLTYQRHISKKQEGITHSSSERRQM